MCPWLPVDRGPRPAVGSHSGEGESPSNRRVLHDVEESRSHACGRVPCPGTVRRSGLGKAGVPSTRTECARFVPPVNGQGKFTAQADVASGAPTPVTYHGGAVMAGGVTIHDLLDRGTNRSRGSLRAPRPTTRHGAAALHRCGPRQQLYAPTSSRYCLSSRKARPPARSPRAPTASPTTRERNDAIKDSDPYPAVADQCASPNNTATCITDGQVQAEVENRSTPGGARGLHNLWFVFLPPTSTSASPPARAAPTLSARYHSVSDVGHGVTIYALSIDPIIETSVAPGADPAGQPRRRGGDRRRRPRDGRGDDRSRGHRLDGPQRVRGRRQVRVRSPAR